MKLIGFLALLSLSSAACAEDACYKNLITQSAAAFQTPISPDADDEITKPITMRRRLEFAGTLVMEATKCQIPDFNLKSVENRCTMISSSRFSGVCYLESPSLGSFVVYLANESAMVIFSRWD